MARFKCSQKNLVVLVRLREHGKPTVKYVRFDGKGMLSLPEDGAQNSTIIKKIRALCGTSRIKGLKEMGGKGNDRTAGIEKSPDADG